jgi:hypothetical protein
MGIFFSACGWCSSAESQVSGLKIRGANLEPLTSKRSFSWQPKHANEMDQRGIIGTTESHSMSCE